MNKISNWFYYLFLLFCNPCNALIGPDIQKAAEKEFPFVVSISFENFDNIPNNEEYHNCGGALLSKKCVLTSAHCMLNVESLDEVRVYVGSNDLRKATPYKVDSWDPYNEWSGSTNHGNYTENDISIIKLEKEISEDIQLGVITDSKNEDFFGKNATVVGWGKTNTCKNSRYLMKKELNVISKEECMSNMKKAGVYTEEISPSIFLCTDSPSHAVIGKADSGGPLIINGNEIIGINDSVSPTGKTNPKEINIHIGVDVYRDDIKKYIKKKSIWPWIKDCGL